MDHRTRGLYIDGNACEGNANSGGLKFKNNILAGYGVRATETGTFGTLVNPNAWIISQGCDTLKSTTGLLTTPYNYTSPDYRPDVNSLALSGASFTDATLAAETATSAANAMATIPATACLGLGTQTAPVVFIPSTTITPDYCSLQWMVTSGVAISNSTAMNPTFTVSTLGTFSITLMVSNANGTTTVVNAITTNTCLDVAVKNNSAEIADVQLSPNPTNGDVKLNIYAPVSTAAIVSVYDLTGKSVIPTTETTLGNGKNNVDLKTDDLQNGIYFVTVSSSKGKKTVKLIVNH